MFGKKNAGKIVTFGKGGVGLRKVTVDDSFDAHVAKAKTKWDFDER